MINLKINNSDVTVKEGSTIMEAAEKVVFCAHFCYHKKLSIAANCRMCLVEVEKSENRFQLVPLQLLRVCKSIRIQRLQKRLKRG